MMKHEPANWRTDLVVFVLNDLEYFNKTDFLFNQLNCSFENRRRSSSDEPMCTLVEYTPLSMRKLENFEDGLISKSKYEFLLNEMDIFGNNSTHLNMFYGFLQEKIGNYGYVDSILMAFDGYEYLKQAGYHYLIRSDMDVFLTPLFARWLPRNCNDFYVGRGGYRYI